jgi:hypothetical protein
MSMVFQENYCSLAYSAFAWARAGMSSKGQGMYWSWLIVVTSERPAASMLGRNELGARGGACAGDATSLGCRRNVNTARRRRSDHCVRTGVSDAVGPEAPRDLAVAVSGSTATLTWTAPIGGGTPGSYVIEAALSPAGPPIASLSVSATSRVLTNVPNVVYYVHVRAMNSNGTSTPSNEVIVSVPNVGGCTSPPSAPANVSGSVSGTWCVSSGACPSAGDQRGVYLVDH